MHQDKMTKEEIQAERDRIEKDQVEYRKQRKTTTEESAKPTPSSTGSNIPNESLAALKTICDDLAARAVASDEGQEHPRECDYNAGTYIVLWRLLEAFALTVAPLGPVVAHMDELLKASLAEQVKSRCFQEESLKTLKRIDERMKRNNEILTAIFTQKQPWKTP